jgi:hypothetical protein
MDAQPMSEYERKMARELREFNRYCAREDRKDAMKALAVLVPAAIIFASLLWHSARIAWPYIHAALSFLFPAW